jgi:hypothetical protein
MKKLSFLFAFLMAAVLIGCEQQKSSNEADKSADGTTTQQESSSATSMGNEGMHSTEEGQKEDASE